MQQQQRRQRAFECVSSSFSRSKYKSYIFMILTKTRKWFHCRRRRRLFRLKHSPQPPFYEIFYCTNCSTADQFKSAHKTRVMQISVSHKQIRWLFNLRRASGEKLQFSIENTQPSRTELCLWIKYESRFQNWSNLMMQKKAIDKNVRSFQWIELIF